MNKWRDSMSEIKFEGRERVMEEIFRMDSENPSIWERISRFMNKEVEIPIAAVVSTCVIVLMIGTSGINIKKETAYAYSITVVNEWGQHETY